MNGEFYRGGSFLPSTRLPKQSRSKNSAQPKKELTDRQIENIKKAIEGTRVALNKCNAENNQNGIEGNTAQLNYLRKLISL